jgi:hypothetical protein
MNDQELLSESKDLKTYEYESTWIIQVLRQLQQDQKLFWFENGSYVNELPFLSQ